MKKLLYILFTIVLLAGTVTSCSKDKLEPTLAQSKAVEGSINSVADVKGLIYGAYDRMTGSGYYGRDFIIWGEVRGDNCFSNGNSGRFVADAKMDYTNTFAGFWASAYSAIATCNIIIGLSPASIEGDADILAHYQGEAYALRALNHFNLLQYYSQAHNGDAAGLGVPYIKIYKDSDFAPARGTIAENQADIYADLDMAIDLMDPAFDVASKQFMSHYGAQALKSRVAIYFGDWNKAKVAALAVVGSNKYTMATAAGFAATYRTDNPANWIFGLAFSSTDNANINGLAQIYRGAAYGDISGLADLYNSMEAGDIRRDLSMIGQDPAKPTDTRRLYTNLGKFPSTDYSDEVPVIRYEEVILNLAEALMKDTPSDPATALTRLNSVVALRGTGLTPYASVTDANLLKERRRELCFEGMRFFDLTRMGMNIPLVDAAQQTHGGPAYDTYKFAFPIPLAEMQANPNMVQNAGYIAK